MYDLGTLIRTLRKERKITQKKLGEMLGVSKGTVSKYEANVSLPPFETMRSIASIRFVNESDSSYLFRQNIYNCCR